MTSFMITPNELLVTQLLLKVIIKVFTSQYVLCEAVSHKTY